MGRPDNSYLAGVKIQMAPEVGFGCLIFSGCLLPVAPVFDLNILLIRSV